MTRIVHLRSIRLPARMRTFRQEASSARKKHPARFTRLRDNHRRHNYLRLFPGYSLRALRVKFAWDVRMQQSRVDGDLQLPWHK